MSSKKVVTDVLTQLSNVLPTGTFLVFQVLAPLSTNNGKCGRVEVVLTAFTLTLLCALCVASCFTDSYKAENGVVYYGFVTRRGLWNPNFKHALISGCQGSYYVGQVENREDNLKYQLEIDDFVNAALSVVALATFSLLTEPVTTCFYPGIQQSILKTVPLLVGLVIGAVCAFGTTPRNGIGFAMAPSH
ncbi:hypothetical protein M758_1G241700 [Ceratodon purpureus]|nr:hypothetical protein M758_1G241700 [Ceratodon purpureus]